ncbi:hypothetical protein FJTKL_13242 [Diaporthe vaccinii]|uniref:Teneurin-like YD-shell domain-containing protein n=1 Tax=Diaporthe vaccinii TaxID=105482 RepID=A0ABR4EBD0_9PEZI
MEVGDGALVAPRSRPEDHVALAVTVLVGVGVPEPALVMSDHIGVRDEVQADAEGSPFSALLDSTYTIDGKGRVTKIATMSTTAPYLNIKRDLAYDGLGQITYDNRSSGAPTHTAYTYDGNSNVLSTTVDGHMTSMTYNTIDQRTDSGFKYDTLGRLLTDDQGHQYGFDGRDRLVSVQTTGATSGFEYRADGYLARRKGSSDTAEMYYNSGKINSMTVTKGGEQGNKTSLFSGSKAIIASYTDEKTPKYFFDCLGSTALVLGQDHQTAIAYDAYGTAKPSSPVDTRSSFEFGQEFTDQTSGLVYLRSRYYSPKMTAFISMDRNHQENRYAYCEGDRINNLDPLGQSWETITGVGAIVVGAVVGAIATAGVSLAVEASLGAAVGLFGLSEVAAAIGLFGLSEVAAATASSVIGVTSAAIGGAAGNVVEGVFTAQIQGSSYTGTNALDDALTGAVGGAAGKLMEPTAKAWAAGARYGGKPLSPLAQDALASGITGAVNNGAQSIVRPVLLGEPINPLMVGAAMLTGFAVGTAWTHALGKGKAQYRETSPRVRARARQLLSPVRGRAQAYRMRQIDIYHDSAAELVAFRGLSGASSAIETDVSDLANSALRSRLGTLSGDHEDLPPLITEL